MWNVPGLVQERILDAIMRQLDLSEKAFLEFQSDLNSSASICESIAVQIEASLI